jgi:tRNA1Val (adenine37-N6)-methyltransferase
MPNNYFQFKKFTVYQDQSAMKVTTDACLFGAWIASQIEKKHLQPETILDIGAGTGLLSLMIAQKSMAVIDSVEIEQKAFGQAKKNSEDSLWKDRVNVINSDVKHFLSNKFYDLIISNPPFFENELESPDNSVNLARHDEGLTFIDLLNVVNKRLSEGGSFAVLLPVQKVEIFDRLAKAIGLYPINKLLIKQTPRHNFFRAILIYNRSKGAMSYNEMSIKDGEGNYTDQFKALLKDYYLHL